MPDEFEDAMRDPELRRLLEGFLCTCGPLAQAFNEVLDTAMPERVSALVVRPQGDGTIWRVLDWMLVGGAKEVEGAWGRRGCLAEMVRPVITVERIKIIPLKHCRLFM
jgi:hypothetical protein